VPDIPAEQSTNRSEHIHSERCPIDPSAHTYSGFILRSPVVSGWPDLGFEAYSEALLDEESEAQASLVRRSIRRSSDILICIFQDDIQTVDIHEHPETIHFRRIHGVL
jgi:hypothetical protein